MKTSEFRAQAIIQIAAHLIGAIAGGAQIMGEEVPKLAVTHANKLTDEALKDGNLEHE